MAATQVDTAVYHQLTQFQPGALYVISVRGRDDYTWAKLLFHATTPERGLLMGILPGNSQGYSVIYNAGPFALPYGFGKICLLPPGVRTSDDLLEAAKVCQRAEKTTPEVDCIIAILQALGLRPRTPSSRTELKHNILLANPESIGDMRGPIMMATHYFVA